MPSDIFLTIKNLDIQKIHTRYNLPIEKVQVKNMGHEDKHTKLNNKSNDNKFVFTDNQKNKHTCNVSMIDFKKYKNNMIGDYHCFWCRECFRTTPIGCPIKFYPGNIYIKYKSISSDNFYEVIEQRQRQSDEDSDKSYYQTDGIFCSFNCCKAFIDENNENPLYSESNTLLVKMYNDFTGKNAHFILPAPHWRTLKCYGGFIDINEFRKTFDKIEYKDYGTIRDFFNNTITLATMYEKKIKF